MNGDLRNFFLEGEVESGEPDYLESTYPLELQVPNRFDFPFPMKPVDRGEYNIY